MKKRIISIILSIVMLVSLLPTTAWAGKLDPIVRSCTCGASADADGVILHVSDCPLYEATANESEAADPECTCGAVPDEDGGTSHEEDCPLYAGLEEEPEEEPAEELAAPAVLERPYDEETSSDTVLYVDGQWDTYCWEIYTDNTFEWTVYADTAEIIVDKETYVASAFRCTVTLGDQSAVTEPAAYNTELIKPSVSLLKTKMASNRSAYKVLAKGASVPNSGRSAYMVWTKDASVFNIRGLDGSYEFQTTFMDKGYRSWIEVDDISRAGTGGQLRDGLTYDITPSLVYDGRYVKITYTVVNTGSKTYTFRIGSAADVMIDKNDAAPVVGLTGGGGLVMSGSPRNQYTFNLVAPSADTLWYGYWIEAGKNVFNDREDKTTKYDKDSGMAWSWKDEVIKPGQTWKRSVLIGVGELPVAPDEPQIPNMPGFVAGEDGTISGTATPGDTVYVTVDGEEYSATADGSGNFSINVSIPAEQPDNTLDVTYYAVSPEGGISEITSVKVNVATPPRIVLKQSELTLMEEDPAPNFNSFIADRAGEVSITSDAVNTNVPGTYTVTYTASVTGFDPAAACLRVTVVPKPAELTAASCTHGSTSFALNATMTYTGGNTYTETGFVYAPYHYPTLTDDCAGKVKTSSPVNTKGGALSASVADSALINGVNYYARPYAMFGDTVIYGGESANFGLGVPSYGSVQISNNNDNTFTVSRTGGSDGEQIVHFRTVNGSAVGGTHFTHKTGTVTIPDGATTAGTTISITERGVNQTYGGKAATAYSNADRTYQVEIYLVEGGASIGTGKATRTMTKNDGYVIDRTIYSVWKEQPKLDEVLRGDYDDDKLGWKENIQGPAAQETFKIADTPGFSQRDYWVNTADAIKFQLQFSAREVEDGYQHIQITPGRSLDLKIHPKDGKWEGKQSTTLYVATFQHGGNKLNEGNETYCFPKASSSSNKNITYEAFHGTKDSDQYVLLPVDEEYVSVGYSGSGKNSDKWKTKDQYNRFMLKDTKEPQLLGIAPMADTTYVPGQQMTLALIFDEIVDQTNSAAAGLNGTVLYVDWNDDNNADASFNYAGGLDTNVLYFTCTLPEAMNVTGARTLKLLQNNDLSAKIKDMCSENGSTSVVYAGKTVTVRFDSTTPTVQVSALSTDAAGFTSGTITASNFTKLEYVWSQNSTSPVAGWKSVDSGTTVKTRQTEGTWYLHARATNAYGRTVTAARAITFAAGGSGGTPVALPELEVSVNNTTWVKEQREIRITTRQPNAATVAVTKPNGNKETVSGNTYTATTNGIYTFTLTSGSETITKMVNVARIDYNAPAVAIEDLTNFTHTAAVTLTVTAADTESGLATTPLSGVWKNGTEEVAATFTSAGDGVWTTTSPDKTGSWVLTVTATDAVGRTRSDTSKTYTIHAERPTITISDRKVTNAGITYNYAVQENGNGGVTVTLPDGRTTTTLTGTVLLTEPGSYYIFVTDALGHYVQSEEMTVPQSTQGNPVDYTAPDVRYDTNPYVWTNADSVTVTLNIFEEQSLSSVTYRKTGETTETVINISGVSADADYTYTTSFTVTENGTYTVTAKDKKGNAGTMDVVVDFIDRTKPDVSFNGTFDQWMKAEQTIMLRPADPDGDGDNKNASGVAKVEYAVSANKTAVPATLTVLENPYQVTISENGTWYIYYKITDNAGNVATGWSEAVKVDKVTPVIAVDTSAAMTGAGEQTVSVTATFGVSGGAVKVGGDTVLTMESTAQSGTYTEKKTNTYVIRAKGVYNFVAASAAGKTASQTVTVYGIDFNSNGATSGDVPADSNSPYISGSTVTVLGNTGGLAKKGYAFVGWNTWANGNGTDYAPGDTFNINSNTTLYAQWKEYEITSQPVENDPSVGTNADSDIASYQWYKGTMSDVTTENASAYTSNEKTSSYSDGWWTCHDGSGYSGSPGYFTITLNAGDSILAQTSAVINYAQLGIVGSAQDWDWTTPDDHFLVTAPEGGNYKFFASEIDPQPTVKAQVFHIGSTPADGATSKTLEADEDGWYACKITYKDGTVLYSGPVEYEAPRIPVTGVTLSESSLTLDVGGTATLTATVLPDNATDKSVSWESSDPTVAKVENGVVTALKPGSTTITATTTDGSLTDTCELTVNKIAITGTIAITTTQEPTVGQEFSLDYIVIPIGNYSRTSRGFSPDLSIEAGKNYTLSVGLKPNDGYYFADGVAATINGKAATVVRSGDNISIQYTYSFASPAANSVDILQDETPVTTVPIVLPGIEQADVVLPFTAKVLDQYGHEMTGQTVEWSITGTNTTGISVNNGTLTVTEDASEGNYILTATCDGKSDSITIQVKKAESVVTAIKIFKDGTEISEDTIYIPENGRNSAIYTAEVYDQYGDTMTAEEAGAAWSHENKDPATGMSFGSAKVDDNNLIRKVYIDASTGKAGVFDLVITSDGKRASVHITFAYLETQTITCANVTGTYGQTEELKLNPSGKQTAGAYRFAIKSGASTDVVEVAADGKLTIKNAGETTIVVTAPSDATHASASVEVKVTVDKADITEYTDPTANDLTYNGSAQALITEGSATGGSMMYAIGTAEQVTGEWSTDSPTGTDIGSYTVYYKVIGDANHNDTDVLGPVQVTISKAKAEITVDQTPIVKTFGEAIVLPTATSNFGEVVCDKTAAALVDVGTYTVTYTVAGTSNYDGDTKTVSVTINKLAVNEPSVTGTYTYTGEEQTATVTGKADYMTETGDVKGTNAGDYTITYTLDGNHCWADGSDGTVTWSIGKATQIITANEEQSFVFGDTDKAVIASALDSAVLSYAVKNGDSVTVDASSGALTINKIGDTVITVTAAETDNYNSASCDITVKIGAKEIDKPTAVDKTYTYDGTEQTFTLTGFDGDTMTISGNTQTNANESGYTVTVTPKENYAWNTDGDCTFTWKIAKADYDMSGVSFENTSNVYDGNEHKPAVSGTLPTGADDIQVTVSYSEGRTDVGETTVTATFATTSTNYNVPEAKTAKQTITAAEITNISVSQTGTLTYTGQPQTATVSASATTVNSQTASFTYCTTENGTYTASVPAFTAAGNHTVYYKVTAPNHGEKSGSFTVSIGKAPVTAPTINSKVYTGGTLTADVDCTGKPYIVTTNAGGTAVGSYDVVLTLSDTTNYKWSDSEDAAKTLKFNITKADNAWTTTPAIADVSYGTAISPVGAAKFGTAAITYVGINDTTYESSTTAPTDAGTYKATFAVAATNDYGNLSTDVTFTIAQKAVTLTTDDKSKVYGENDPELTSTLTGGLVGTDTLNYTLSRAEGETVGTYTISAVLGENPNYAVTVKNDGKLTISKATPTVQTALTALAIYGNTVDDDDIRGAMNVPGSFAWKNVTSYGNATAEGATTKFDAVFTPTDAVNYETLDVDVAVTVLKASQSSPAKGEKYALSGSTLTAESGYELFDGTDTRSSFTIDASKTYSIRKAGDANHFASPYTAIDTTVTVNVLAVPSSMGTVSGSGKYAIGSNVTLTASPRSGYEFVEWQDLSGAQKSTNAKYTIPSITTGQTLIAAFKPVNKTVVTIPTIKNATYDKKEDAGVDGSGYYTLEGLTKATNETNAGAYTVTATLSGENTVWSDGTTAPKTLVWNIFKASQNAPENVSATENSITGVNDTMEYMKMGGSSYTGVTDTTISDLAAGTYYVRVKETENYYASPITVVVVSEPTLNVVTLQPSDLKSDSVTLNGVFAPYKAGCTAKFLLNGAEKQVESVDENGVFSLTTGLEPDTDYMVTAVVNDTQGNTVTFHTPAAAAAPVVVEDGKIKVNVTAEGSGSSKFIISVERGNDVIASCTSSNASGDSATANFDNLPYGNYNVVVRTNNGHYTETKMLSVAADNKEVTVNFTIPVGKLATVVDVKTKETPKAAVDGLSEILSADDKKDAAVGSKDVEIKLEVEKKNETQAAGATEIKELLTESASENVKVDFIDMSLIKTTTELDASGNATSIDTQNIGATNNTVIKIAVPYDSSSGAPMVLRYHNGMAQELTKLSDRPTAPYVDGTYFVDEGYVFIYASGFSTYAISYAQPTPHGGRGSDPTVVSAPTGDAGLALYVALSVSSMLGMGWVGKKKRGEE